MFGFSPESVFTFSPESRSESSRNPVHLQPGTAFTFARIPQRSYHNSALWRMALFSARSPASGFLRLRLDDGRRWLNDRRQR